MTDTPALIEALEMPEKPEGWTRKMTMHLNFGGGGGVGVFEVFNPNGALMPFGYQYDTRKDGLTGFTLAGVEGVLSWSELREHYAALRTGSAAK